MPTPKRAHGRKLLIASIGVATVSYLGCSADVAPPTSGNLMPPDTGQGGQGSGTAVSTGSGSSSSGLPPTSGNLVPPMPDASPE